MPFLCIYCKKGVTSASTAQGEEEKWRTMHKFPIKSPAILKQWLKAMKFDENMNVSENVRLCSDHFDEKSFNIAGKRRRLISGSVPSIFQPVKCVCCGSEKMPSSTRTFHKFPRHEKLLQKWLAIIRDHMPELVIDEDSVICSVHFDEACFRVSRKKWRRLRDSAIPKVFSVVEQKSLVPVPSVLESDNITDTSHSIRSTQNVPLTPITKPMSPSLEIVKECMIEEISMESIDIPYNDDARCIEIETSLSEVQTSHEAEKAEARKSDISADHNYVRSLKNLEKKYEASQRKIRLMQQEIIKLRKRDNYIRKRYMTLKEAIRTLRKKKVLPISELQCLDELDDEGVSQLLRRVLINQRRNPNNVKPKSQYRTPVRSNDESLENHSALLDVTYSSDNFISELVQL